MNKVILVGNVGRDPEIRYVGTRPVASFTLATTERGYTSASGNVVADRTEWHNIVMWDKAAETAERYIRKGTKIAYRGKTAHSCVGGPEYNKTYRYRNLC